MKVLLILVATFMEFRLVSAQFDYNEAGGWQTETSTTTRNRNNYFLLYLADCSTYRSILPGGTTLSVLFLFDRMPSQLRLSFVINRYMLESDVITLMSSMKNNCSFDMRRNSMICPFPDLTNMIDEDLTDSLKIGPCSNFIEKTVKIDFANKMMVCYNIIIEGVDINGMRPYSIFYYPKPKVQSLQIVGRRQVAIFGQRLALWALAPECLKETERNNRMSSLPYRIRFGNNNNSCSIDYESSNSTSLMCSMETDLTESFESQSNYFVIELGNFRVNLTLGNDNKYYPIVISDRGNKKKWLLPVAIVIPVVVICAAFAVAAGILLRRRYYRDRQLPDIMTEYDFQHRSRDNEYISNPIRVDREQRRRRDDDVTHFPLSIDASSSTSTTSTASSSTSATSNSSRSISSRSSKPSPGPSRLATNVELLPHRSTRPL